MTTKRLSKSNKPKPDRNSSASLLDASEHRVGADAGSARRSRAAKGPDQTDYDDPRFKADFEHAAKQKYWEIHEAAALSLGKDPNLIDPEGMADIQDRSEFAYLYMQRLDLFSRAFDSSSPRRRCDPAKALEWAEAHGVSMPPALLAEFEKIGALKSSLKAANETIRQLRLEAAQFARMSQPHKQQTKSLNEDADINPKLRRSLEKLSLGMAMDKFNYQPGKQGSAPENIQGALHRAKIKLDVKTIRERLTEAGRKYLDKDWD